MHLRKGILVVCALALVSLALPALAQDADNLKSEAAKNMVAFGEAMKEELAMGEPADKLAKTP